MNLFQGKDARWHGREATEIDPPAGSVVEDFKALRVEGSRANYVLELARMLQRWRHESSMGRVRLLYVVDYDGTSALDWLGQSAEDMGMSKGQWEAIGKRERQRVEREGAYGLVGQYRVSDSEDWEDADSVWGFVGDDGLDAGGYAADSMHAALDALETALTAVCECCGRPKAS